MKDRAIVISEIFGVTIQGEGPLMGRPTVFVRTGGCDYRCHWCDTSHAVLTAYQAQWLSMRPLDVVARVDEITDRKPILVTLSGGNPALQPMADLINMGHARGHTFALETQGTVAQRWFADLDWLVLSPKPPSAGTSTAWDSVDACLDAAGTGPRRALKIVVLDDDDYHYARAASARFPGLPLFLQVGNPSPADPADNAMLMDRFRRLVGRVVADRWFDPVVLPQLHVLAWGNKRGV
jgi:7-carboxy-7-deazaguanine synthase